MLVDFYFAQKTFFPKDVLPNSGCGLSTDAAYTRVNTVFIFFFLMSRTNRLPYLNGLLLRAENNGWMLAGQDDRSN